MHSEYSSRSNFNMALYNCTGVRPQWLQSSIKWEVEVDDANRRYRVKVEPHVVSSWSGPTSFTIRNFEYNVGNNVKNTGDHTLPNPITNTDFSMGPAIYSDWFAFDDQGKATVKSVGVGCKFCWRAFQQAAGGNCWDLREFCTGSLNMVYIDPSIDAENGGPGAAYTDVGQVTIQCKATGPRCGEATSNVSYGTGKPGENRMTISGALSGSTSSTSLHVSSCSLQPNSNNNVTAYATNGVSSSSASCSFVTLCENTLSNCRSIKSDEIMVDCTIAGGYGVYPPTTDFKYRLHPNGTWNSFFQSKTKTKTTATIGSLKRDTYYDIQACTQTTAGTYCGNIITCKTTPGAYAIIDSIDPYIKEYPNNEKPQNTRATVCYSWNADCAPVDLQVFYRIKNAFDDKWYWSDVFTSDQVSGSNCITLIDLVPNGITYEAIVRATGCDGVTWDSPIREFVTPMLTRPYEWNCKTLTYMDDLICQALEAIKHGNKTIYANAETQEKCDPYSENPTLSTLWSRFLRWGAGSACLMCDMIDFVIKSGKKNQYFVGEIGWVDILQEIEDEYDEDDDDGKRLASSGAIYNKIQEKMHEVWHYHGTVDYGVDNLDDVPENAKTVLNFADDKVYEKVNGEWVISTTIPQPDDFAVYHFNYENKTEEVGTIKAESAWYYWAGTWNNLDVNIEWMVKVIDEMYTHIDEFTYTEKCTDRLHVRTDPYDGFDCNDLVQESRRTLDFILEPFVVAPKGYHLMKFVTGEYATIIQNQEILDGALAQQPNDPEKYCMDFVIWHDQATGAPYDWNAPVYTDYTLEAIWTPHPVKITFDIGDKASGTTPTDIDGFCGNAIGTLPDDTGFFRPGGTFKGWAIDGVPIDSSYILSVDKTAEAIWEMQKFNVTFHPTNGQPDFTQVVVYDEYVIEPATDPTYANHIFMGWFTGPNDTDPEFDFINTPIYANTDIYAHWVNANVTVTFDSDGGSPVPSQTIPYDSVATMPSDPTKSGYLFNKWVDSNGDEFDFSATHVTEDITLYAVYNKAWEVTFNLDGGSGDIITQIVEDGDFAQKPTDPTKDDCSFCGWYDSSELEPDCPDRELSLTDLKSLVDDDKINTVKCYYPLGTEVDDEYEGANNPWIVADIKADEVTLIHKYVTQVGTMFNADNTVTSLTYADSDIKTAVDTTFKAGCSAELLSIASEITLPTSANLNCGTTSGVAGETFGWFVDQADTGTEGAPDCSKRAKTDASGTQQAWWTADTHTSEQGMRAGGFRKDGTYYASLVTSPSRGICPIIKIKKGA